MHVHACCLQTPKEGTGPLELEAVVSYLMQMLGTEPRSHTRPVQLLATEQVLISFLKAGSSAVLKRP